MCLYNWIIIFWTILVAILANKLYGEFCNPCNIINIVWCLCSTLSVLGLFDLYVPKEDTFKIILIFMVVFSSTSVCSHLVLNCRNKKQNRIVFINNISSFKKIYLLFAEICILLLPLLIKCLVIIKSTGIKGLHNSFLLGASGYMGFWGFYIYAYIIRPFFSALMVIAAYSVGIEHKHSNRLMALALVGGITHYIVAGGRKEIFNVVIFVLIVFVMKGHQGIPIWLNKKKLFINIKSPIFKMLFLIPLIIIMIGVMTMFRLHFGLGVIGTFWMYMVGPMSYLDIIINNPTKFGISIDGLLYGKGTWGFITGPIETFLSVFIGKDYQGADYLMGLYTEKYYMISPSARINATATIIYTFLRDYGNVGIIVGTLQFAIIVSLVYYMARNGKDKGMWICILIYIYFTLIFSVWRYTLVFYDGYMTLIWIVLFFKARIIECQNNTGE